MTTEAVGRPLLARLLRVPPAGANVPVWHVSAIVDVLAYHLSWLWVLVPMVLLGPRIEDYVWFFLLILGLNFSHRHLTFPYVYLDGEVFRRFPWRFTVFPAVMVAMLALTPWAWQHHRGWVQAVATFAGFWNLWHVYMQKYGILRMYAAKSGVPPEQRAPGWVDRLLIFGFLPLIFTWGGPLHRETILRFYPSGKKTLVPMLDWLATHQLWLVPLAGTVLVAAVGLFVWAEWRASRLRNPARLLMAGGTTALSAAFLVFDPFKVALAFAFSHALEYVVFVWAFQRRQYREMPPHRPILARLLRFPWLYYVGLIGSLTAAYIIFRYWGRYLGDGERIRFGEHTAAQWIFWWAIYQSMMHFYFDGFLWKMRKPTLRHNL